MHRLEILWRHFLLCIGCRYRADCRKCNRKANLNEINLTAVLRHKSFSQLLQLVYCLNQNCTYMYLHYRLQYGGGTGIRSPNIKICFEIFHRIKNFNWPFRVFTLISYKLIFSLKCSFEHMFIYFVYSSLTSWLMLSKYVRHVFSITPKEFQIW